MASFPEAAGGQILRLACGFSVALRRRRCPPRIDPPLVRIDHRHEDPSDKSIMKPQTRPSYSTRLNMTKSPSQISLRGGRFQLALLGKRSHQSPAGLHNPGFTREILTASPQRSNLTSEAQREDRHQQGPFEETFPTPPQKGGNMNRKGL